MLDVVRGIVIGEVTADHYYTFHDRTTGEYVCGGSWFATDAQAIAWFKEHYPRAFAAGVEMRCHN